jgi:hypothetical protein
MEAKPFPLNLQPKITPGGEIETSGPGNFRLSIEHGKAGVYRLAQLDDYTHLSRSGLAWAAPCDLELRARISAPDLPGTWGFGFWNDPFSASLGFGGMSQRLPALPNTAWFFHASPPNFLSLRDSGPAQGLLAAAFSSPLVPPLLLAPGLLGLPLLAWPAGGRLLRRLGRRLVKDVAARLELDPTAWHRYRIEVKQDGSCFFVDGVKVYETTLQTHGRLGLVIWIDNQYAAFNPDGKVKLGSLANPPAWLEVDSSFNIGAHVINQ